MRIWTPADTSGPARQQAVGGGAHARGVGFRVWRIPASPLMTASSLLLLLVKNCMLPRIMMADWL